LRALADRLAGHLRSGDPVGRYGGEEFALLLPETPTAGAIQVAERLRLSAADDPLALGGVEVALTASIGAATGAAEAESGGPRPPWRRSFGAVPQRKRAAVAPTWTSERSWPRRNRPPYSKLRRSRRPTHGSTRTW